MNTPEEDKILQDLMNTILLVAMEDGEITKDELAILKQVKLDVQTLRVKIEELENEPYHEEHELKLLKEFKKNILQNAYNISQTDKKITTDERNIINSLISKLMK